MKALNTCVFVPALFVLAACGGGGGSVADSGGLGGDRDFTTPPAYSGETAAVQIAGDNALQLLAYHALANDALESLAAFNPDYYYKGVFLTESFVRADATGGDVQCESGSFSRSGQLDAGRRGEVVISFNECQNEGLRYNGEVRFVGEDRGQVHHNTLYFTAFSALSLAVAGDGFTAHGELSMPRPVEGSVPDGYQIVSGDLLLELPFEGRQIAVSGINKAFRIGNDYALSAIIDVSHLGRASFVLDSTAQTLQISSATDSIDVFINADNEGRSLGYDITMRSSLAASAVQRVNLDVATLGAYLFEAAASINVAIQGDATVDQGSTITLRAELAPVSNNFFVFDWQVDSFSGDCVLDAVEAQGPVFSYSSTCAGELVLTLQASNDKQQSNTARFTQRVLKSAAEFSYAGVPAQLTDSDTLNLPASVQNADQGPFAFSLAYGAGGATVGADGRFQWDGAQLLPVLGQNVMLNYGVTARNDNVATEKLSFNLQRSAHAPVLTIDELPFTGMHVGGVDLDPDDPTASIAYLYIYPQRPTRVVKLDKSTLLRTQISDSLPGNDDIPRSNLRRLTTADVTGDGVDDVAYIVKRFADADNDGSYDSLEVTLLVYDYVAERIAMQPVLLHVETSSTAFDIYDIQLLDIDADQSDEILFYVSGPVTVYGSSERISNSVVAYDIVDDESRVVAAGLDDQASKNVAFAATSAGPAELLSVYREYIVRSVFDGQAFVEHNRTDFSSTGKHGDNSLNSLRRMDVDNDGALEYVLLSEGNRFSCLNSERSDTGLLVLSADLALENSVDLGINISSISTGIYGEDDTGFIVQRYTCDNYQLGRYSIAYIEPLSGALVWEGGFEPNDPGRYSSPMSMNGIMAYRDAADKFHFVGADNGLRISQ